MLRVEGVSASSASSVGRGVDVPPVGERPCVGSEAMMARSLAMASALGPGVVDMVGGLGIVYELGKKQTRESGSRGCGGSQAADSLKFGCCWSDVGRRDREYGRSGPDGRRLCLVAMSYAVQRFGETWNSPPTTLEERTGGVVSDSRRLRHVGRRITHSGRPVDSSYC